MSQTIQQIRKKMDLSQHFTIFVLGDSITEGARATNAENTYTAVFARGLASHYEKSDRTVIRYDGQRYPSSDAELLPLKDYGTPTILHSGTDQTITVVRSGIGGNTVQRLLNRKADFIGKEIDGRTADLYIIMAGINDALSSDPKKFVLPEVYRSHLNILLDELKKGTPSADLILMTPTYNDKGEEPISRLDPYADAMLAVAKERSVPVIDLHKMWMEHLEIGGENFGQGDWLSGVSGDKCHPGDIGHAVIGNAILSAFFEP